MSYAAALEQLNAMVPELHHVFGQPRRKFSLDEIRVLLEALGNPQKQFRSVLIGGTNGKGSTASTLASILKASGIRTGLYTSPHLERANERIRVNGVEIGDDDFARAYFRIHDCADELVKSGHLPQFPSFFEVLTALAFLYFAGEKIDLAVLEVGMGGRLDATNVVDPIFSVVTDISLDHTEWLGPTISAIAREKAGIMRPHGTLITLPQHPEANRVLGEVATELEVRGVNAAQYMPGIDDKGFGPYSIEVMGKAVAIDSPLIGAHQRRNLSLAIASAVELAVNHGLPITPESIAAGVRETRWPARMERLRARGVDWVLDVAHNPAGAWALRAGLQAVLGEAGHPRVLVFSCLRDKAIAEMAQILFPLFDRVIVPPIHSSRAADPAAIVDAAAATGVETIAVESVASALEAAATQAGEGAAVVSGSVYLVGEARSLLMPSGSAQ